jgi:hypothetical protein
MVQGATHIMFLLKEAQEHNSIKLDVCALYCVVVRELQERKKTNGAAAHIMFLL